MKKYILPLVLLLIINNFSFSQSDWQFVTLLEVGKRPIKIFNYEENMFSNIWFVYCAGYDANQNGILDDGDEAPSIWYFGTEQQMIVSFSSFFGNYTKPKKLMDLDFQNIKLPYRFDIDHKDNMCKIYLPEPNGVSEVIIKYLSGNVYEDNLEFQISKKIILEELVNAISVGYNKSNQKLLYLSKRDAENMTGNVLAYNMDMNEYADTLPARAGVQMTLPLDYRDILILNEKFNEEITANYMNYHVAGYLGDGKHSLINDIELDNNPNHIFFHSLQNGDIRTIITFSDIGLIRAYNGSNILREEYLNTDSDMGLRETIYGVDSHYYTSSYDAKVYMYDFTPDNIQIIDKLKAYGQAESIFMTYYMLFIATPYIESSDETNNTITFYAKEPVSVSDNFNLNELQIFPNPASNIITINDNNIIKNYEIFSILGEKLFVTDKNTIDISKLANGIYYIRSNFKYYKFIKN